MKLDMTFEESNQRIELNFAEVQQASDGGFERGYDKATPKATKTATKTDILKGKRKPPHCSAYQTKSKVQT